ncbi:hypothetical protein EJ05DRAFT_509445 [Pseudovirgaria hyperparasitica]|uniref:Uncharacterized protein n=1 Tax=Pseudovirgaria hyperparasitica TaxID=470096 RepID=A0A6A6WAN4_9PEZI|nr:uncharacterized protein EJ05DRAFT_509445 [Pseudovirgaria hyperparasitica]KAF2759733.1 hypothetical protein EJ05DRAFT_509445 [Pseudovirgaria hyperparasitica]
MLATQLMFMPQSFAPARSSPLSERSSNACPRRYNSAIMSQAQDAKQQVPYSKRSIKQAPINRGREEVRDKRRDLFLKKVKEGREDRNWEAKGEQILRMDFMKEQKKWETEKARSAPKFDEFAEDDEPQDEIMLSSQPYQTHPSFQTSSLNSALASHHEEAEAEALLRQEQEELDAMLAAIEDQENIEQAYQLPSHFGSDDEDYDSLFMDYLSTQEDQHGILREPELSKPVDDEMDTS